MQKPNKLTGIRLIAQEIGVSTATVSRALNDDTAHKVKESTRTAIMDLSDKLQFRLNPGARIMQRGLKLTIGILIPRSDDVFESEYYGRFIGGVIHATGDMDWDVRILTASKKPADFVESLKSAGRDCTGLIVTGTLLSLEVLEQLKAYRRPLVLLKSVLPPDYPTQDSPFHVIGANNQEGGVQVSQFLNSIGHRRIGLILGPKESRDFAEREQGYFEGLARCGITVDEQMCYRESYDDQSGRRGCAYFLDQSEPPTALICANDNLAFGALDFAKSRGISCPENLSIVGFDDGLLANCCSPKLTTVRQPLAEMAERAVKIIFNASESRNHIGGGLIELETSLNIRESTQALL